MVHRPIELHPQAIKEGRKAREWYAKRSPAAADAFMAELDHAIDQICEHPGRWPTYLHGTRRYPLKRFPYVVVYCETEQKLRVLAIAHGKRKPGYWQRRLKS